MDFPWFRDACWKWVFCHVRGGLGVATVDYDVIICHYKQFTLILLFLNEVNFWTVWEICCCCDLRPFVFSNVQNKCTIHVVFGDFKDDLKEVVMHLKNALPYADTDEQREIVTWYVFLTLKRSSFEEYKQMRDVQFLNLLQVTCGYIIVYTRI